MLPMIYILLNSQNTLKGETMKFLIIFFMCIIFIASSYAYPDFELQRKYKFHNHYKMNYSDNKYEQCPIDVLHYELDLTILPKETEIRGKVKIIVKSQKTDLVNICLDLIGLTVDSVNCENQLLNFSHAEDKLTITLPRAYAENDTISVTIDYHGQPAKIPGEIMGGFHFYGDNNAYTVGQGVSSGYHSLLRVWLPCHDVPYDKATFDMTFCVPYNKFLASNGTLVEQYHNELDSTSVYHWVENHPMATYLATLSLCNYSIIETSVNDTIPIFIYSPKQDSVNAVNHFRNLPEMVKVFSDLFGPYMFDKVGYTLVPLTSGAMEHQTCITYPLGLLPYDSWEWVIVHELAHHWWGNWVTLKNWRDIWLNEGFATYSEILFYEFFDGYFKPKKMITNNINYYLDHFQQEGDFPIYNHPVTFGVHTYSKACLVLHMLRNVVGDDIFFKALKKYGNRFTFGNVTTADFQAVVEEVSNREMGWFFNQWIYGPGHPVYEYAWSADSTGAGEYVVSAFVRQVREDSLLFNMPLELKFISDLRDTTIQINFSEKENGVQLITDFKPDKMELDPDTKLLCEKAEIEYNPFSITDYVINDDEKGNGNSNLEPGETVRIEFELTNTGFSANNVTSVLSTNDESIIMTDSMAFIGNFAYYSTFKTHVDFFEFSIDSNATCHPVNFNLKIFSEHKPLYTIPLQLNILSRCIAFYEGFESLICNWDLGDCWQPYFWAYEGLNSITDSPTGYYENNAESILTLKKGVCLSDKSSAFLEFYQIHLFAAGDSGLVQIMDENQNWQTAACYTGSTPFEWQRTVIDLNDYCLPENESMQLRFNLKSDAADNGDGWYIDNVKILVDTNMISDVQETKSVLPKQYVLSQNYPNPFNPETSINYEVPKTGMVKIEIYNSLGQKVKTLLYKEHRPGYYTTIWDGRNDRNIAVPSGIYFYKLTSEGFSSIKKMLLLR